MSNQIFKFGSWLIILFTSGILVVLSVGILAPSTIPNWIGTNSILDNTGKLVSPQKTLWDLLDLLIIPVVLTVLAVLFNRFENKRNQDLTDERNQEESLQSYLGKIGELILDKNIYQSEECTPVRTYARAITLTTIHRLNSSRKGSVFQFLKESGLIEKNKTIISLAGTDFREINIKKAHVKGKNLSNVNFTNAILNEVIFAGSNLTETNFTAAKLQNTDLKHCIMTKAILRQADLTEASLEEAELVKADLKDAILCGANLNANLTGVKLDGAKYTNATIWPKGFDPEKFKAILIG